MNNSKRNQKLTNPLEQAQRDLQNGIIGQPPRGGYRRLVQVALFLNPVTGELSETADESGVQVIRTVLITRKDDLALTGEYRNYTLRDD